MKNAIAILLLLFLCAAPAAAQARIQWLRSYNEGIAEAAKSQKPLFIDAFADWCVWCHELDKEVYSDPSFVRYMQNYIPVRIDVEKNSPFAEEFRIDSLPTIIVTDHNGKTINRISGYMTAPRMMADLNMIQELLNREKTNPADLDAKFQLANEYLSRDMFKEASERFSIILNSASAGTKKEPAQFSIALAHYYSGDSQQALEELKTYRTLYPQGSANEDALLLMSEIHLEMDENDKAQAHLTEFLRKYPKSGNANRARQILSLIKQELNDTMH